MIEYIANVNTNIKNKDLLPCSKANTNTKSHCYQPVISHWSNLSDDEFYLSFISKEGAVFGVSDSIMIVNKISLAF